MRQTGFCLVGKWPKLAPPPQKKNKTKQNKIGLQLYKNV